MRETLFRGVKRRELITDEESTSTPETPSSSEKKISGG